MTKDVFANVGQKDLSKQLCKLAEIEAKRCNRNVSPLCNIELCRVMKEKSNSGNCKDMDCPATYLWVDFEHPANFVKLLECLMSELRKVSFESNGIVCINDGDGEGYSLVEATISFIKVAYEEADEEEDYAEVTLLKQALQATDWRY